MGLITFKLCDGLFTGKVDAALYMYDITDQQSFLKLLNFKSYLSQVASFCDMPSLILGNKMDLDWKREVQKGDPALYNMRFLEVSAKTGTNVEMAFEALAKTLLGETCQFE